MKDVYGLLLLLVVDGEQNSFVGCGKTISFPKFVCHQTPWGSARLQAKNCLGIFFVGCTENMISFFECTL